MGRLVEQAELLDGEARRGMTLALWAQVQPERTAVIGPGGDRHSFFDINANANRLVRCLRAAGLGAGDSVALICPNRVEFVEVLAATLRGGFRLSPINWHLTPDEISYIIADCQAKAVFYEARVYHPSDPVLIPPDVRLKVGIGGEISGFESYDQISSLGGDDIEDPTIGNQMLYTSGTTGRPRGVYRPNPIFLPQARVKARRYDDDSVQLCAGPAYHGAPLSFDLRGGLIAAGTTLVLLDKWDTETTLRAMSDHRVSHTHMVPIMFQRLLALPVETRANYDPFPLRYVLHGAAPCPPDVKRAMIDWFGPVVYEYYAGSEGGSGFVIDSEEWLRKPGSVGKCSDELGTKILMDDGSETSANVAGTIYMQIPPGGEFYYFNDDAKTQATRIDDYFTMGDIGYFDEDGYLFLTGRDAETIISGGVNIYPTEIDNVLMQHPAVADCATVGVPHPEWGEEVKAVVLATPQVGPSSELAEDILSFARARLPAFKAPRSVDFTTQLPRTEAGKIQRGQVRAPYWAGQDRQI